MQCAEIWKRWKVDPEDYVSVYVCFIWKIPEARQSKGAEAIIKQIIEEKRINFKRLEASEQKGL